MNSIINILVLLGGAQGLLLAFVFVKHRRFKAKTFKFFALLLFSISLTATLVGLKSSSAVQGYPIINFLPFYLLLIAPFALYYCIQYLLEPAYQFKKKEYLLLLPFLFEMLFQLFIFFLFLIDSSLLQAYNKTFNLIYDVFEGISVLATIIILPILIYKLNQYESKLLELYSNLESKSLTWIRNMLLLVFICWLCWLFAFLSNPNELSYYYPLFFIEAMVIYYLAYSLFTRNEFFEFENDRSAKLVQEPKLTELSSKTDVYFQELLQLFEEEQVYKDPELNLSSLAKKMGLSGGYLSQIINKHDGRNFFDFVNSYRIEEVKKNFANTSFDHYSILGIALDAGFKSKSTFNAVFKKMTGKTPSAFKKQIPVS